MGCAAPVSRACGEASSTAITCRWVKKKGGCEPHFVVCSRYVFAQDGEDDAGWGCAYRALQTQCSWLRLAGLSARPVPTLGQIGAALAALGEPVAPRQWIGAVETALLLQAWYGLDCRILDAASGPAVAGRVEELHRHFTAEGSPVAVGGGVLAWTLLGVATAPDGETRFLIMDPHYTGGDEDLKSILKKGWVAWQPLSVFRKDCFYNFSCPLVSTLPK